jgi:hypothetical protein
MRTKGVLLALFGMLGLAFLCLPPVNSQTTNPNERHIKPEPSKLDKVGIYSMEFIFKDPRIIVVKMPGRGERICWYMWFQVINRSPKAEVITPTFELVTLDSPGIYRDDIFPTAEEAIKKLEDPTGYQKIKNTVLISRNAIPVSKPADEAFPNAVTGVAIWDAGPADPKKRDPKHKELSDSTRFSIFIRDLSNGFVEVDAPIPGERPIAQYKTLQLNFKRKGDRFSTDSRDIEFVAPAEWIYRSAGRTISLDKKDDNKDKK